MRNLAFLVTFLLLMALPVHAQDTAQKILVQKDPVKHVLLAPLVHNNVDFYSFVLQKANLEGAFCIIGRVSPEADTARLNMLVPAWIDTASSSNAIYQPGRCDMPKVIGTLHFHPGFGFCQLSPDDIVAANNLQWPIMAIVCIEKPGDGPKVVVVSRKVFRKALYQEGTAIARSAQSNEAVYRYREPPKPKERSP